MTPTAVAQEHLLSQLDALGNASIIPADVDGGSTDNVGIASLEIDKDSFSGADLGINAVELKVTDTSGNSSVATANVTVEDNMPPVAMAKDITVQLDATGKAAIIAADVNDGSFDNVAIGSLSVSPSTFDLSNVGAPVSVTLTVTDTSGLDDSALASVTVEDNVPPVVLTQDITVQLDASGNASITPVDIDNGSDDAAGNRQFVP